MVLVVTIMNSTHKLKDTELEIENNSPVFKLQFSLHPVFVTRADCMIRLKLHIRNKRKDAEYAAIQL